MGGEAGVDRGYISAVGLDGAGYGVRFAKHNHMENHIIYTDINHV